MGPVLVALVAIAIMLVFGVVVAVVRLLGALRRLRTAIEGSRQSIEPAIAELNEAGQVVSTELAQLQTSVQHLGAGGRPTRTPSPSAR